MTRVGDSAQASDIKQLCDSGIAIEGIVKEPGTKHENWDEWRASLLKEQGRIQEGPASRSSSSPRTWLTLMTKETSSTSVVREAENLRWEETKTDLGIEQKPAWGKQPNHAIDALSYLVAKIHRPINSAPLPPPTTNLVKPFYPRAGGLITGAFKGIVYSKPP